PATRTRAAWVWPIASSTSAMSPAVGEGVAVRASARSAWRLARWLRISDADIPTCLTCLLFGKEFTLSTVGPHLAPFDHPRDAGNVKLATLVPGARAASGRRVQRGYCWSGWGSPEGSSSAGWALGPGPVAV